jgi:hypothetical protein
MKPGFLKFNFHTMSMSFPATEHNGNKIRFFDQSLCVRGEGCSKSMKSMIHRQACILDTNLGKRNVKCVRGGKRGGGEGVHGRVELKARVLFISKLIYHTAINMCANCYNNTNNCNEQGYVKL